MHKLKLIIIREYLARVRNKTFMIMTFLSPIIMVGMVFLIAYLSSLNNDEDRVVAIHDQAHIFSDEFESEGNTTYLDLSNLPLEKAMDSVNKSEYYGLLYVPDSTDNNYLAENIQFIGSEAPNNSYVSSLEQKISTNLTNRQLIRSGIDLQKLEDAKTKVSLRVENFKGKETSKMSGYIKMFFGAAAGYLLMMFIIIYGNMVMRSVIEEKTNRIVEIIISSVKPIQLMMGKILGTSFAGITQFLIWIVFGGILFFIASSIFGIDIGAMNGVSPDAVQQAAEQGEAQKIIMDILSLPLAELIVCFLIYFILGYFLYSSIYAAIGAAVDNETDTQQFMFPVILPLMLAVYVGFFSVIQNPHGVVSTVFAYIPLTSPIVMLMRIPFGVAWWEIVISMTILLLSVFGVIWVAAKIYRVGILMYGKKPTYKDMFKWMKY